MGKFYIKNISKIDIHSTFMGRHSTLKSNKYTECTENELIGFQQAHPKKVKQYTPLHERTGFYPILTILVTIIIATITFYFSK